MQGARRGLAVALPAIGAGALVWALAIRGSLGAGGRSFAQVERYSAELTDFVAREPRHGIETFVLLGWLTPLLALVGVAVAARARPRLALVLALGAAVPALLALGGNLPAYEALWETLPGLRDTRVPGRLLPIAALCVAGLAALALARAPRAVALAAVVLVAIDLRAGVGLFEPARADPGNAVYAARPADVPLLELPLFLPDRQEGSVYLHYALDAPGPRYGAYSTLAPKRVDGQLRELKPFECGRRGLHYPEWVMVHRALYAPRTRCLGRLLEGLNGMGYREVARDGTLTLYRLGQ